MRDKKTTLFNKCRILVEKTEFRDDVNVNHFEDTSRNSGYSYASHRSMQKKKVWIPEKKEVIEKESPLGFVYTQTNITGGHWEYQDATGFRNNEKFIDWKEYQIYVGNECYKILYPASYNENRIDKETRPWDLIGEEMPTHFVQDLLTVLNELTQLFKDKKVALKPHVHKYDRWRNPAEWAAEPEYDSWSLSDWKIRLYEDIFGNSKGPRYMTDEEKILAHGFDLKESFRKAKEK